MVLAAHWKDKRVLVTGGASFIGSHLVDILVSLGTKVTVIDDLSSGKIENLSLSSQMINFVKRDLEFISKSELKEAFRDIETVFHLAAVHGGRGFITSHPADVCSNFPIDHHVFEACLNSKVENVVYASTACVYPTNLQDKIGSDYLLKEQDSDPFNLAGYMSADIEYGWAKLMGEVQLISFNKQYGLKGCPVRFVTAYGPRENETHAIIALIYKSAERMDPFEIWGNGNQERDFTYVQDIVEGTILAGEKISDCTPVNLGTGRRYKIMDVCEMIWQILGWRPRSINLDDSKPVGALSRALSNTKAHELLSWSPRFTLEEGLKFTVEWYLKNHTPKGEIIKDLLLEHSVTF